jgi:energy-coupling factor transporter ATP-binding protein EcfA2
MAEPKETRRLAAQKVKVRRASPKSGGDRNVIGRVSRGGVAIQGDYNDVQIQQITQVFQSAPPSVEEEEELARLKKYVPQAMANLKTAIHQQKAAVGNPYHLLEALDVHEQEQLAGRNAIIKELAGKLERGRFAFLVGENGIGKTSLLRAGLMPALAKAGHWPVWIEATGEPLDATIKKRVFGSLNDFPALSRRPLKDVLRLSAVFLPQESQLILLVDNAEEFFRQPATAQQSFADLWKECVNDTSLRARWLFSMVDVKHYLTRFQSGEENPFGNLTALAPLDRAGARQAILIPAKSGGIRVEDALLDALLDDLGNAELDPTRLQIVCHTLAGGNAAPNTSLNLSAYEKLQRADGILLAYLDRAIHELAPDNRDPAWQILSILEQSNNKPVTTGWIGNQLSAYGYMKSTPDSLLETLQLKHLVSVGEDGFRLASENMKPRIRQWSEQEAVPRQIQKEAARQLEQIRNSALRGLLGGAVGFGLFRWIVGNPIRDPAAAIFLTLLYATVGGLIGLLLTFSVDVSIATFLKARQWLRYVIGGMGGAIAFGLALALFVYLSISSENPLVNSLLAALEGGVWGLAAGLGIAWGMHTSRPAWISIPSIAIAGGITLALADSLLNVLTRSLPLQIAAGGLVFPLFIAIGARMGRRAGGIP